MSTRYPVGEDDVVATTIPATVSYHDHSLPIIFEDENVIVIDKPAGVLTHAKGATTDEFSVAEFVKDKTTYKADTNRPGIIHRLDRDTSGVILVVKNDETAKKISKQFQDRTVKKVYYAVVDGTPKQAEALIDLPIARNPSKPSTFRVDVKGKSAQTHFVVEQFGDRYSLVRLEPKTGRTHQLRVHMSYLNTPIKGDRVYGKESDRLYLHAAELEVTLPGGVRQRFYSPVPEEFTP